MSTETPARPDKTKVDAAVADMQALYKQLKKDKKNTEAGVVMDCLITLQDVWKYWSSAVFNRTLACSHQGVKDIMTKHGLDAISSDVLTHQSRLLKERR